jgi:DNA-binding CsgD family transcriptional regulator
MTMSNPNFFPHFQSEFQQPRGIAGPVGSVPTCMIYSNHPLAFCLIRDAICSDPHLRAYVRPFSTDSKLRNVERRRILVIDTCSVENWMGHFQKWRAENGLTIAMVSAETCSNEVELQMLYLGVSGVLAFGDNLVERLPKAIHAVADGHLWIRREVLNTYVQRVSGVLRKIPPSEQKLTSREKEIAELLQREFSNRTIAQKLNISERTIKFHVSNILRKLNVANRRELQALNSNAEFLCPEWLLREEAAADAQPRPPSREEGY